MRARASRSNSAACAAKSSTISSGVGSATKATAEVDKRRHGEDHAEQRVGPAARQPGRGTHRPGLPRGAVTRFVGDLDEPANALDADVEGPHRLEPADQHGQGDHRQQGQVRSRVPSINASIAHATTATTTRTTRTVPRAAIVWRKAVNSASRIVTEKSPPGLPPCRNCTPWPAAGQFSRYRAPAGNRLSARMPILVTVLSLKHLPVIFPGMLLVKLISAPRRMVVDGVLSRGRAGRVDGTSPRSGNSGEAAPKTTSSSARLTLSKARATKPPRSRRASRARARAAANAKALREAKEPHFKFDESGALVPDIRAEAAIIYDPRTGQVLWEQNSQAERSIASITKVMTAAVVLENPRRPRHAGGDPALRRPSRVHDLHPGRRSA